MNFYYVKLSCPKTNDGDKFGNIINSCLSKKIETFEITNISNNLNDLKKNDSVVFILSGDNNDKNRYFKHNENLKNFVNGIYAIGKVTSISPVDSKFSATLYPLHECVSREQLYFYPQFADNLGAITKGIQNQAGAHVLSQDAYLSLLDYLTLNNLIDTEYALLKEVNYTNKLAEAVGESPIFLKAKGFESFRIFTSSLSNQKKASIRVLTAREFLIKSFCSWFAKPENFKVTYEGVVKENILKSWDRDFFNDQLFLINPASIEDDIALIKKIIENIQSRTDWVQFNASVGNGVPKAVLGNTKYLKFLDEFLNDPEQIKVYRNLPDINSNTGSMLRLSKPFILLAGISGTGKTRFIREQASRTGSIEETYQLIPVRPDWHEPSDLLGYVSRISGAPHYVATDVLRFLARAWTSIVDNNVDCQSRVIRGKLLDLKDIPPHWLCLDEMNLAPVEQYFADFLSILETRLWVKDSDQFEYSCDALLKSKFVNEGGNQLRLDLGLMDAKHDALWAHFSKFGISIPFNLIVAGTVNMDETTHGFSRKVLDRALSFDFGDFFPNVFESYFSPNTEAATLGYPTWSNATNELNALSTTIDKDGARSVKFLSKINEILEGSYFKIAYRSLNDLLLSVIAFQPQSENELQAVWDDFLMCKILPRIEGDFDKLTIHRENNDGQATILSELKSLLQNELSSIWDNASRPDLYRQYSDNQLAEGGDSKVILISCRSKNKILWMENRLANTSFTSYWP